MKKKQEIFSPAFAFNSLLLLPPAVLPVRTSTLVSTTSNITIYTVVVVVCSATYSFILIIKKQVTKQINILCCLMTFFS